MNTVTQLTIFTLFLLLMISCKEQEEISLYTGREVSYTLTEGAYFDYKTTGNIVVKERTDRSVEIQIFLEGTMEDAIHPVHLHYGSLEADGYIAQWLNVMKDTGNGKSQSITHLSKLYDESEMTYDQFLAMDGSIKIHFEEYGSMKNVILGAANIGKNFSPSDILLSKDITICNSKVQ